jgi:thioredoxin:protein disulfide reductase
MISDAWQNLWHLATTADSTQIKNLAVQHSGLALVVCFASGVLTSLTPCVYPMIPITINIFGRLSHSGGNKPARGFDFRTFGLSGIYVAGMCFTYSVMGLVAGLTGSLFGKVLQSSYMLAFLTILFAALALGQLGLFKLALPGSLQTKLSQYGNAESKFGIFLMGLFSGLIVSPCVGPVIAGILAFVVDSSDALKGFLYFLSFSLGLGVLFLLIGGFSGILARLPRSGTWMTRINRLLACLMLIASVYYGSVWAKQVGILGAKTTQTTSAQASKIPWYQSEQEALRVAKEKNLPVLVDFTAVWCEACHVIDQTVFQDDAVVSKLQSFVPLRIDVSEESEESSSILQKYGVLSLPTLVFVDRSGKILTEPRVHGVLSPAEFLAVLEKI